MKDLNNIEKTLKYYELLMIRNLDDLKSTELQKDFSFVFWDNDNCIDDWVSIHLATGEFNDIESSYEIFHNFYDKFYNQLSSRCLFIENEKGEKIATATISPAKEYGYNCVIDWFAISPKAQGYGLAKPLLYKVLQIAKELGYEKILLHTQTHTWLAAKIYLDCGFMPFMTENNLGWNILKTITNHPKLSEFKLLEYNELFDELIIKIKKELDKLHKHYTYSVWYINNRNDIFVHEQSNFYKYKYQVIENEVILNKI